MEYAGSCGSLIMSRCIQRAAMALVLALASCRVDPPHSGGGGSGPATGELVFFSGRLPPTWTIPAAEVESVRVRLNGLEGVAQPSAFPLFGTVAYRVINSEGHSDLPDEVLVQNAVVQVRRGSSFSYFSDQKQLEYFLKTSSINAGAYAELGIDP